MTQLPPNEPPDDPRGFEPGSPPPPPAPGPSGWTGPTQQGPGRRSNAPLIIVAVLVVAALIGGGIVLLAGGDDDEDSTETSDTDDETSTDDDGESTDDGSTGDESDVAEAEAVVRDYFQAVIDQDCQAIFDAVTESSWSDDAGSADEAISQCQQAVDAGQLDIEGEISLDELEVTDQTDDSVSFEAIETIGEEQVTETFTVVREGGDWKIDLSGV